MKSFRKKMKPATNSGSHLERVNSSKTVFQQDSFFKSNTIAAEARKTIQFSDFHLPEEISNAIDRLGFTAPTPIQAQAFPLIFNGDDILATAQTGTGKTVAFVLPLLCRILSADHQRKSRDTGQAPHQDSASSTARILMVAPTRELAQQIATAVHQLTLFTPQIKTKVVIGGESFQRQSRELWEKPTIVVGTPGRLLDLSESGHLDLSCFSHLVLDEADRMLDMGFQPQIESIAAKLPRRRQTLMFSATLPPKVRSLVGRYLRNPASISVGPDNRPVDRIKQNMIALAEAEKDQRLVEEIDKIAGSIMIFTRTKQRADQVADLLSDIGHQCEALHGDLTQAKRRRVTERFRNEETRILVATDVAARGLDIPHVRHVINYDLPLQSEDYVHRIGRTGRAGADGHSIAFVTPTEKRRWTSILALMGLEPMSPRTQQTQNKSHQNKSHQSKSSQAKSPQTKNSQARRPQFSAQRRMNEAPHRKPNRTFGGSDPNFEQERDSARPPRASGRNKKHPSLGAPRLKTKRPRRK